MKHGSQQEEPINSSASIWRDAWSRRPGVVWSPRTTANINPSPRPPLRKPDRPGQLSIIEPSNTKSIPAQDNNLPLL